jgi:hypothetical protein
MKPFFILLFLLISTGIFSQNGNAIHLEKEQQYKDLIKAGDKLMLEYNYAQAEVKYYDALQLLPEKVYAKNQLEKAKSLGEKKHQELKKDSTILTFIGDSQIIPKSFEYKAHACLDTTVLVVSKIVGESIELNEKIKFGLFNDIENSSFAYALYLSTKGKALIEVKFTDGSTKFFPYTIQELMDDTQKLDRVDATNLSSFSAPIVNGRGRLRLKVKKLESKKSDSFKEGHHFYYTTHKKIEGLLPVIGRTYTYDDQYMMYAKIIKILNHGQPAIEIEKEVGLSKTREFIPLSDIVEISKTLNSRRFKIGDDAVLFIESY